MFKKVVDGILNHERFNEIEFLVQKLTDDYSLEREVIAKVVTATFHRLAQIEQEKGYSYIKKIISYASDNRKIAKGTWDYLDKKI